MKKRNLIIIIAAVLLFFVVICIVKLYNDNIEEENMPELEAVQQIPAEETVKIEEIRVDSEKVITTPVRNNLKQKSESKTQNAVTTKAQEDAVQELETEAQTFSEVFDDKGPSKVVIIDKEYKVKSPEKYSFK